MPRITIILVMFGLLWTSSFPPAIGAEFHPVGRVEEGWALGFSGFGMSADGGTIVSGAYPAGPGRIEAYRWEPGSGRTMLGFFSPTNEAEPESYAYAASEDGSTVVGSSFVNVYDVINLEVYEVTGFSLRAGVFTSLPWLYGDDQAYPLDVTHDGCTAVGASYEVAPWLWGINYWLSAVRWDTASGSVQDLGTLGSDDDSFAVATSRDASVIVGQSGEIHEYWRPAVWIGGAWHELQRLSTSGCPHWWHPLYDDFHFGNCNSVYGVSSDGLMAAGRLYDGTNIVPVRWHTAQRTPIVLPLLPGDTEGAAFDATPPIAGRGWIIGGTSGGKAVLWGTEQNDPIEVEQLLRSSLQLGDAIEGWQLAEVREISDDGKVIAGYGIHPNGQWWIWYADLRIPPDNDQCGDAEIIREPPYSAVFLTRRTSTFGTTLDATPDGDSTCADPEGPSVWYSYSAPVEGYLYLDLCGTMLEDPVISVHTGCPASSANEVFCSRSCPGDPSCSEPCILPPSVKIEPFKTYFIRVSSGEGFEGGDFTLHHQFLPINDGCEDAFFLRPNLSRVPGVTKTATVDLAPTCQGEAVTAPGVWYKVVGTGNVMIASLCGGADYDTKLSVYCSGCGGMTCVGANDDVCGVQGIQSSVSWCSAPGAVYHILVHGFLQDSGSFWLDVSDGGSPCTSSVNCHPINEWCLEAMPVSEGTVLVDNTGADTSSVVATCRTSRSDVWFHYTTECDGEVWVDTCQTELGSLTNTVLSVYDACWGSELGCNDDYSDATADCGARSAVVLRSLPNEELSIRVATAGSSLAQGTFPLRVTEVPGPVSITGGALPDAWQRQYYSTQLSISGGCPLITGTGVHYFVSAQGLPLGMEVTGSGLFQGAPRASGVYPFTVTVADREITTPGDSADFTLRVLPANEYCTEALPVVEGFIRFGTDGTTTDGPDEPGRCDSTDNSTVESDIWFRYIASCTGTATASLCGSSYDTKLALYGRRCPVVGSALACNDDYCGRQSKLVFEVTKGDEYLLRVGGHAGAQGNGVLMLSCFDDCNGNGVSDLQDLSDATSRDCNANGTPDECDLPIFAADFGRTDCITRCAGDYDGDGVVDGVDLSRLVCQAL